MSSLWHDPTQPTVIVTGVRCAPHSDTNHPSWAKRDASGTWKVGMNAYTSGKPTAIPLDPDDEALQAGSMIAGMLLDIVMLGWTLDIGKVDLVFTPPTVDTISYVERQTLSEWHSGGHFWCTGPLIDQRQGSQEQSFPVHRGMQLPHLCHSLSGSDGPLRNGREGVHSTLSHGRW